MATIDYTSGPARLDLGDQPDQIDAQIASKTVVLDDRRTRARYFDGRFLAARDLTREQTYALVRQADLGNARRGGVIRGLQVMRSGNTLHVAPGAGLTGNGELVTLPTTLTVAIGQIPEDDRLDISFGVVDLGQPAAGQRAGFYVLGLRAAEYAANPITRYPTMPRGAPGIEDGDILEVAALALHPFRYDAEGDPDRLRSAVAREIFLVRGGGVPADVLPLAMVFLDRGSIRWLDPYLLRREVAADDAGPIGLGTTPRSLREAHFLQYDQQLGELTGQLRVTGGLEFPASRYFRCLPPVGRLPAVAIDPTDFSQVYFPPQMTVTLGVVVDEELPALLEASLNLPPIDLDGNEDDFDFTYVQALIPMPASQIARLQLKAVDPPRPILLPPALGRRLPIDALRDFKAARTPPPDIVGGSDRSEPAPLLAAWRQALAAAPGQMLWYTRVPALAVVPVTVFELQAAVTKDERDTKTEHDDKLTREAKEDRDTKNTKDAKTDKDTKPDRDAKAQKDAKTDQDAKIDRDGKPDRDKTQADNAAKAQRDAKTAQDTKNSNDAKTTRDTKNNNDAKTERDGKATKDAKDEKDTKPARDAKADKDAKTTRDAKNEKDGKPARDAKAEKDAKATRDAKTEKDAKATRDAKTERDAKTARDAKEARDGKNPRDVKAEKDRKTRDARAPQLPDATELPIPSDIARAEGPPVEATPVRGTVRTFIQPRERPDLDSHVLHGKPGEPG